MPKRTSSRRAIPNFSSASGLNRVVLFEPVKQLTFNQVVPLNQDETGTVRIRGSRVTLDTLVSAFKKGNTAEQIQGSFPSLSLRRIYGAISYFLDHQEAVESYLNDRQVQADAIRREIESQTQYSEFREKLRRRRAELIDA
ncbi:MAG: hypothetical protein DMF61_26645 [Blastocatellia bacterium AA13]|nr:MAG: hypothetical protein DMF61_26645 [Blastocatellia bacterium AA13]